MSISLTNFIDTVEKTWNNVPDTIPVAFPLRTAALMTTAGIVAITALRFLNNWRTEYFAPKKRVWVEIYSADIHTGNVFPFYITEYDFPTILGEKIGIQWDYAGCFPNKVMSQCRNIDSHTRLIEQIYLKEGQHFLVRIYPHQHPSYESVNQASLRDWLANGNDESTFPNLKVKREGNTTTFVDR